MQQFTPYEYTLIDYANNYGKDKLSWKDRIEWANDNYNNMHTLLPKADNPFLFIKSHKAIHDARKGNPTGFVMSLDATASGLQILGVAAGCPTTCREVNLINTGKREDAYQSFADYMNKLCKSNITKKDIKHPVMTSLYGSKAQPRKLFGEDTQELEMFYKTLYDRFPGAVDLMSIIQSSWNQNALAHTWTLPDGHTAHVPVMQEVIKKIEVDELGKATFSHKAFINEPSEYGISLLANITHSIDGFIVREMVRQANNAGFELLTIHDSFWASPNHIQKVRQFYLDILRELAKSNIMQDILRSITGNKHITITKRSRTLATSMASAEYALS